MTDVLRFSKKAFTWSVVGLTILWSMGVSALMPLVANAATCVLENGDDATFGTNAVYTIINGKRFPWFHANHYKTQRQGYESVVKCSASDIGLYPLGDVVPTVMPLRAGELWKLTSEPAVFMVMSRAAGDTDPRAPVCQLASEAQALEWKFNLKTDVLDLPDYLNGNYRRTGMCTQPNGLLVSNPGSNDVYLVSEGMLWKVDGSLPQFLAKEVHVVATGLSVGSGSITPATIVEKSLPIGGGSVVPPASAGALTVSLASDTPAAGNAVTDGTYGAQAMIPVLKVNVAASAAGSVNVTSLKFRRGGISADTEINNAHLYLNDMWVASNPSISNGVLTFSNAAGLFTVPAGTSHSLTLKMDLKNNSSGGKSLNFTLTDVGVAAGSVAGLPLAAGQTFTTVSVNDLGRLALSSITPSANGTVDPGLTGYEVWRFQAVSTNQDMELRKLTLTVVGSVSVGDLKNFSLWNGATQIGTTVPEMSSARTVTFDLSANPFVVTKGQTKLLSVKADIVGGTNRTFRVSLQNDRDVSTFDKQYQVYVKANGTDSFSIVEPNSAGTAVNFTINTGSLTQTVSTSTPTGNIADGATNVELARFNWQANGEAVKISSLSVSSTASDITNVLANVRLLVNGSQVGTTDASLTASGAASSDWGSFGNSFIIPAGQSVEVKVVADLTSDTVAAGETFKVGLSAGSSNAQGVVSLTSISSVAQVGSTLTVRSGTVTVSKNSSFGNRSSSNPTGPVNASQVKVASITIVGGSGEDVELSQISLKDDNAGTCIGTYMQNLTLRNAAGVQLGTTYANPSTSCAAANTYTFNVSPAALVTAGGQYVVDVFADMKAAFTTANTSLIELDSVTANGRNTGTSATISSQALSLQDVYISSVGSVTVAIDSDAPLANNLLMGAVDQSLAKFKLTASNAEPLNISELVVSANVSANATGTLRNIRLYDEAGVQIGSTVASPDTTALNTSTYANMKFSNLQNLVVPKGQSKVVTVKADLTPYEAAGFSTTGQAVQLAILADDVDASTSGDQLALTSTGAQSGTALTQSEMTFTSNGGSTPLTTVSNGTTTQLTANNSNVRANEFVLYRAKINTAWAGDTPSGASAPNAAQIVGKFVVSNVANSGSYSATVDYVNLSLSSTISNANTSRALNIYKDSLSTSALATSAFITGNFGTSNADFGNTRFQAGDFTDVEISAGSAKTFFVTLDTSGAASAKNLSITIPVSHTAKSGGTVYGVVWSDGVTSSIAAHDSVLPLLSKTFTY